MLRMIKNFFAWFIGIFLILSFLIYFDKIALPSILLLISGMVLLPPINNIIREKISGSNISDKYGKIRNIIIIFAVIFFADSIPVSNKTSVTPDNYLIDNGIVKIDKEIVDESITDSITETNGIYIGPRVNGKKEGQGKYEWNDGSVYEGEFQNDKINGQGKVTIPNKGIYIGNFIDGKKNGQGKYTFNNGDIYDGSWVDDKISGTGVYTFANGDSYEGDFLDNQFNGYGTYTKNGKTYSGKWSNNKYNK